MPDSSRYSLKPLTGAARAERVAGLTNEERRILLHAGTETPFCGGLLTEHRVGLFVCRLCHLPLFRSQDKFDSRTGWPSFSAAYDPAYVTRKEDCSHGMLRTEVRCARCASHLGHVFPDGPPPAGERFCINSACLSFFPEGIEPPQPALEAT